MGKQLHLKAVTIHCPQTMERNPSKVIRLTLANARQNQSGRRQKLIPLILYNLQKELEC